MARLSVVPRNKEGAARPYIEYQQVEKRYPTRDGGVQALQPTSFNVQGNEFLSLLGPSGCGKSTLMMITAGLIPATAGSVTIAGRTVKGPYTDLGIVFQSDILLDWRTVMGNILLQAEFRGLNRSQFRDRALELLDMVGLGDVPDRYPWELSGGMRQRVALCRALVHDPPLLLMDEPFGALDALTRDQLNLDLQRIWMHTRKTIIFVTHSITEAVFLSDRILVMSPRPGRIIEEMHIDLPRPRQLAVRETPEFGRYANQLRNVFRSLGVLKD